MSFDFSTLVTDRLQSDVDKRNAKGTYNAADLNRVTAAMEALDEMFRAYGYYTGYVPIFVSQRGVPPATFRYIRFTVQAVRENVNNLMQLSEIKFKSSDGSYFQYPSSTSVTSSVAAASADETAEKVTDGLTSTKFCTEGFVSGCYLTIDLGSGNGIDLSEFTGWEWWTANDDENRDPVSFSLSVSNSPDSDYTVVGSETDAQITTTRQALAYSAQIFIDTQPQLPSGYTQLEYIQSSGNAYIDTGVKPNQNTGIEIEFQTSQTSSACIAGADSSWRSNGFSLFPNTVEWSTESFNVEFYGENLISASFMEGVLKQDGNTLWSTSGMFSCPYNLTLFALNRANTIQEFLQGKIYWCKIYSGDALVRNFVPCKNISEEIGFYDVLNGSFYKNLGSGSFTAGPEIQNPNPDPEPVLDPYTWYESDIPLQSQMAQYLANLAALRGALVQVEAEPLTPESMELLTYVEANDIEQILLNIEAALTTIGAGFLRAGMPWAVAGGPEIFARNGGTA